MNKTILFGLTVTILMFSIIGFTNTHTANASIALNSSRCNCYKTVAQLGSVLPPNSKALILLNALIIQIQKQDASGVSNSVAINNANALLTAELLKSKDPTVLALSKALNTELSFYNSFKPSPSTIQTETGSTSSYRTTSTSAPNPACQSVKAILTNSGYSVTLIAKVMTDMKCS